MQLNLWVLKSSWTSPLSKAPSALVDFGPFYCVVWQRGASCPLLGHTGAVGVCTCAPLCSSWEHWEWGGGFHLLWSLTMRQGSSPGCCAALQAEPQPFCGCEAPAQTKHMAVCNHRKRTLDQFCQVRPSSCAQTVEEACHVGFLVSWWSIVCSLETASTIQPTTVLELLRGGLGGILRKLEMLKSCLTFREALQ